MYYIQKKNPDSADSTISGDTSPYFRARVTYCLAHNWPFHFFSSLQTEFVESTSWSVLSLFIHHVVINPSHNFRDETKIVFIQKRLNKERNKDNFLTSKSMTNIKIWTFLHLNLLDFHCLFSFAVRHIRGTRWRSLLRHCATRRKVAG